MTEYISPTMHIGKKISRIRELKSMKQETLASILGISQQGVSKIEQSETVDDERLEAVAKALGVSPNTIRNFNEEAFINNIQNNYDNAVVTSQINNQSDLHLNKITDLYERLLASERERSKLLESLLNKLEPLLSKLKD
jgi:transcriptional regulator with XRE-family HTH domain